MMRSCALRLVILGSVISLIDCELASQCFAERVGYSFRGALTPTIGATYTLFGAKVPNNSPITGTFSYDTSTTSVNSSTIVGAKEFKHTIHGGFTWNVLDAASQLPVLQLAAHEYSITFADNYLKGNTYIDAVSIDFSSLNVPKPTPIWVNGAPYAGATAVVSSALSWPASAIDGESDPKIPAELPIDSFVPYPGAARSGSVVPFMITSFARISPSTGDLNLDGRASVSDYFEWRKAFGGTSQDFPHADTNADGIVDSSDYILWRKAATQNGAGAVVPEPTPMAILTIAAVFTAGFQSRRVRCRARKSY